MLNLLKMENYSFKENALVIMSYHNNEFRIVNSNGEAIIAGCLDKNEQVEIITENIFITLTLKWGWHAHINKIYSILKEDIIYDFNDKAIYQLLPIEIKSSYGFPDLEIDVCKIIPTSVKTEFLAIISTFYWNKPAGMDYHLVKIVFDENFNLKRMESIKLLYDCNLFPISKYMPQKTINYNVLYSSQEDILFVVDEEKEILTAVGGIVSNKEQMLYKVSIPHIRNNFGFNMFDLQFGWILIRINQAYEYTVDNLGRVYVKDDGHPNSNIILSTTMLTRNNYYTYCYRRRFERVNITESLSIEPRFKSIKNRSYYLTNLDKSNYKVRFGEDTFLEIFQGSTTLDVDFTIWATCIFNNKRKKLLFTNIISKCNLWNYYRDNFPSQPYVESTIGFTKKNGICLVSIYSISKDQQIRVVLNKDLDIIFHTLGEHVGKIYLVDEDYSDIAFIYAERRFIDWKLGSVIRCYNNKGEKLYEQEVKFDIADYTFYKVLNGDVAVFTSSEDYTGYNHKYFHPSADYHNYNCNKAIFFNLKIKNNYIVCPEIENNYNIL